MAVSRDAFPLSDGRLPPAWLRSAASPVPAGRHRPCGRPSPESSAVVARDEPWAPPIELRLSRPAPFLRQDTRDLPFRRATQRPDGFSRKRHTRPGTGPLRRYRTPVARAVGLARERQRQDDGVSRVILRPQSIVETENGKLPPTSATAEPEIWSDRILSRIWPIVVDPSMRTKSL
jgi:hypothetical protein